MKTFFYIRSKLLNSYGSRYSLLISGVILIFIANLVLQATLGDYVPMTLFIGPIIIAAMIGGWYAGLTATVLGAVLEYGFLMDTFFFSLNRFSTTDYARLGVYFCVGSGISFVFTEFNKVQRRFMLSQISLKKERAVAEKSNRIKSLFLANMSHEIRTPLMAIVGFTELLKDENLNEHDRKKYLETIERTGKNLTNIVNDILDISKIEANCLETEKVSFCLQTLLSEIYLLFAQRCADKSVQLEFIQNGKIPHKIKTDPHRLRQILLNIIGNAVKFTGQGMVVVYYEVTDSELLFKIEDTGIGMTEEQQQNLFENFRQGDSSITRRFSGTGLGLVISQSLASKLVGAIVLLNSSPGRGSTFLLSIAYEQSSPTEEVIAVECLSSPKPLEHNIFKNKLILLAEDNLDNQYLMEKILTNLGFRVKIARNGEDAINQTYAENFDLLLMDMHMPIMDGYTATQILRERGFSKPIIALTASAMKEDRGKCLEAGCTDYLTKPLQMKLAVQTLFCALKNKS